MKSTITSFLFLVSTLPAMNVLLLITVDLHSWLLGDADRFTGKVSIRPNESGEATRIINCRNIGRHESNNLQRNIKGQA